MKTWGCTTPFGSNKTHICTNKTIMKEAIKYHDEKVIDVESIKECINPCKTIIPTLSFRQRLEDQIVSLLTLEFPSRVKGIEAYQAYIFISFIAEVGGWVGLFLGVSVLDLRGLFSKIINLISQKIN